ncbi:MAG TPA: hypothetical protein VIX82_17650 [Solirubrobacteraceae bacterium]
MSRRSLGALVVALVVVSVAAVSVVAAQGKSRATVPVVPPARAIDESARFLADGAAQQAVDERAYPRAYVTTKLALGARADFLRAPHSLPHSAFRKGASIASLALLSPWQELGPITPLVPGIVATPGRETTNSGRTTAVVVDPNCGRPGLGCRVWVAAAGGGIWRTNDALATSVSWQPVDNGLTSGAIGSLVVDRHDPTGNTLYAGSGEQNGSGDSEAGVGLFKTTDGGDTWTLVPGSVPVAHDRSIGTIAIDPTNPNRIYIGTDLARHGSSSVNGGRRTPPGAPKLGLYESTNGGASFGLVFSKPADPTNPATGTDWFTGGVNKVELDPRDPGTVYVAVTGYGIWRQSQRLDSNTDFHQVFETLNPADSVDPNHRPPDTFGDRTEFDLTTVNTSSGPHTRIYVGDSTNDTSQSEVWRTDNADVPASQLADQAAQTNLAPWTLLSSPEPGKPGFASYGFCEGQCDYDIFVAADPRDPNTVVIGGSMNYPELPIPGGPPTPSNGRAVLRSTDAGAHWADMTGDAQSAPYSMHPDQHAIAFDPQNPAIFFVGSDGGLVASNGRFDNHSADCTARGLTGKPLALCEQVLSAIPDQLNSLNNGLADLQFQSVSLNPANPGGDVLGGTQDNGTWSYTGSPTWFESVGGDGGQSATVPGTNIRVHTYFGPTTDVNFHNTNVNTWDYIAKPMDDASAAGRESFSFYVPMIADPRKSGTLYMGGNYIWRTTDNGGNQTALDAHCRETPLAAGDHTIVCGDWRHFGPLLSPSPSDYIVALARTRSDTRTMWVGLRYGQVFITHGLNTDSPEFQKLSTPRTTERFVSGITIDPNDPNHAWISFSGYNAYTPATPGHVFEVRFHPATKTATWINLSHNLGDLPITGIVRDDLTGDLYVSTDFGVLRLPHKAVKWERAASGLPIVATYGLTIDSRARLLYAATHGRGVWRVRLG